jgi:hypothetical protein
MPLSESLNHEAERHTASKICPACQKVKATGKPFCIECFLTLPPRMRAQLNLANANNYGSRWDEAKDWLRENS